MGPRAPDNPTFQELNQTVKRMVWALSLYDPKLGLGHLHIAVALVLARLANHDDGWTPPLSDEEITEQANQILPLVPTLVSTSRSRQRRLLLSFLKEH